MNFLGNKLLNGFYVMYKKLALFFLLKNLLENTLKKFQKYHKV